MAEVTQGGGYPWITKIQGLLHEVTSLTDLLLSLDPHIEGCAPDWRFGQEHNHNDQMRVIGVGLVVAVLLRPHIQNWAVVGGWIDSPYEPFGLLAKDNHRRLAIIEKHHGPSLSQVLLLDLSYESTLRLLIQLAVALFYGWSFGVTFNKLNLHRITVLDQPWVVTILETQLHCSHTLFLHDYAYASYQSWKSPQQHSYYNPNHKIALNEALAKVQDYVTNPAVSQALAQFLGWCSQYQCYDQSWLGRLLEQPWCLKDLCVRAPTTIVPVFYYHLHSPADLCTTAAFRGLLEELVTSRGVHLTRPEQRTSVNFTKRAQLQLRRWLLLAYHYQADNLHLLEYVLTEQKAAIMRVNHLVQTFEKTRPDHEHLASLAKAHASRRHIVVPPICETVRTAYVGDIL